MGSLPPFMFLIFTLAAFAVAGGLLVWVIGYIGGKGKSAKKREQPASAMSSAEPETCAPAGEQELLRVSRTKGGLAVFVQGQRYRHLQKITDPKVGRETIEALKSVLTFAEGWLPSTQQQPASSSPPAPDVDQATFIRQLRQTPPPSPPKPTGLRGMLPKQAPHSMLERLTFVSEIDDMVQQRLEERPDLARHRIRLTANKVGLSIQVDQQTFDAVDDIPDPQIKALIRDAIREWEGS